MPSPPAIRWLLLLVLCGSSSADRLPERPSAALSVRVSRDADRPAPCRSAVCRWEWFRAQTLPDERRRWPAGASLALAQLRLTAGPDSELLANYCRQRGLVCLHPLCPCGPRRATALGSDTPDHDDMCNMLCDIGEGGSECNCMKPPAAVGPETDP